jgi:ACS family hexuronate transporter-like MFS transporter
MRFSEFPHRWRVVALLFFLSVLNYLDRQTLSVLAPTLEHELGFSTVQYSYIVTTFLIAYAAGYLFCGSIIDRLGVKLAVVLALGVWSTAGIAHAFASSWVAIAGCRFVLGLGESFNSPSGIKAISEWIPRRERGLCMAIFSNGNILGAIIAPPLVSFVAIKFGWQWGFLVTGAAGLLYLLWWWKSYHAPESHPRLPARERDHIFAERGAAGPARKLPLLVALRDPAVAGFFVARLLTDSLSFFFSFWLPAYLESARGFSLAMIGFFGWIPFLASDIGGPGGGALSDWLVRRGWKSADARRRMLLVSACIMPCALIAVHVGSPFLALGLIAVLLASQSCWMSNMLTLMSETFPREQVATCSSLASVGGSIGGIISTLLAGRVIQAVGYVPVFTTLGFLHFIAFAVLTVALRIALARKTARTA